jgi:hypothetical protein
MKRVFISYAQIDHKDGWIDKLAEALRSNSIEVIHDQSHLPVGADISYFMEREIQKCDKILVILSESYKQKADNRVDGVGDEYALIVSEMRGMKSKDVKVLPILRSGSQAKSTPLWMQSLLFLDMRDDDQYDVRLSSLLQIIMNENFKETDIISFNTIDSASSSKSVPPRTDLPAFVQTFYEEQNPNSLFANFDDGIWLGGCNNGRFTLINSSSKDAIKYFHFSESKLNFANMDIQMDVQLSSNKDAQASLGILFSYNPTQKHYFLFGITQEGTCNIYRKDSNGVKQVSSIKTPKSTEKNYFSIGLSRITNYLRLEVNNFVIATLDQNNFPDGDVGIYALGSGEFHFENLKFYKNAL